ncbi:hypothetical protein Tco_0983923, partial [Tanacetum coccineum]
CITRSSTNELYTPYKDPEREFRSSKKHFKSLSLDELISLEFNLLSNKEYLEEEEEEAMAETMEQYMSKTRTDYLTSPRWSVSTATREDTLQGNAGHLGIKTTGTRSLQKGLYDWSDQAEEGPTNFALMAYSSTSLSSSTNSESVSESIVEKHTVETNEPKNARKENGAPNIKDWVSKSEEEDESKSKTVEMFYKPSFSKINFVKSTEQGNPQQDLKNKGVIDSGCSRHMTGNRSYITDYEEIDGGFVHFGDTIMSEEMLVFIAEKEESRSPSLLDAPTNPGPCLLSIISCPILALGSK